MGGKAGSEDPVVDPLYSLGRYPGTLYNSIV